MDPISAPPSSGAGTLRSGGPLRPRVRGAARPLHRPSARDCDIRLTLPARAENVAVVRHLVGSLAEAHALPPLLVEDIRLAVTEACSNVVRHAYRDTEGSLDIAIRPQRESLTVVVSDHGGGIVPHPEAAGESAGLGLPLIAALTHSLQIDHSPSRGSRLAMSFGPTPEETT